MELELNYCVIPRIVLETGISDKKFTMFITSKRIALILSGKSYRSLALYFGGIVGAGISTIFEKDKPALKEGDIDKLLSQDKLNMEIPMDGLIEIKLRKELAGKYRIFIYGLNKKNKKRKLVNGYFEPDLSQYADQMRKGLRAEEALILYLIECQEKLDFWLEDKVTEKFNVPKLLAGLKHVGADQL